MTAGDETASVRTVLMGPPGSGKGTQGARLAKRCNVVHLATGDLFRQILASEDSELARTLSVINEGRMIPDDVVHTVVFRELDRFADRSGFVLDGYPRTVPQAEAFEEYLGSRGWSLDGVVALEIPEEALVARLSGRLTCPNCGRSYHLPGYPPAAEGTCDDCGTRLVHREDDHPERIRTRFAIYHEKTEPLLAFYRERNLLRLVDGSGDEETVFAAIVEALR